MLFHILCATVLYCVSLARGQNCKNTTSEVFSLDKGHCAISCKLDENCKAMWFNDTQGTCQLRTGEKVDTHVWNQCIIPKRGQELYKRLEFDAIEYEQNARRAGFNNKVEFGPNTVRYYKILEIGPYSFAHWRMARICLANNGTLPTGLTKEQADVLHRKLAPYSHKIPLGYHLYNDSDGQVTLQWMNGFEEFKGTTAEFQENCNYTIKPPHTGTIPNLYWHESKDGYHYRKYPRTL